MRQSGRSLFARLVAYLAVAAMVAGSLQVGSLTASAEEAPGPTEEETVVGEFVQVWPDYEVRDDAGRHSEEGPLSYVRTDDGDAVRLDTVDVEDLDVGATVEVTVGDAVRDSAARRVVLEQCPTRLSQHHPLA